jgi:hypothetical protein
MISLGGVLAVGLAMNPSADAGIKEIAELWKRSLVLFSFYPLRVASDMLLG